MTQISNHIPYKTMDVITYPCPNPSKSMLVKGYLDNVIEGDPDSDRWSRALIQYKDTNIGNPVVEIRRS